MLLKLRRIPRVSINFLLDAGVGVWGAVHVQPPEADSYFLLTQAPAMTSSPFDPFILENGFVLLDGGLATELEAQGADLSSDLWSARLLDDNPSLIRDTHLAYYRAGADVATSASYQASYEGFLRKGFDREKATKLLLLSVKLAVEARDLFWQEYQQQYAPRRDEPPLQTPTPSSPSSSFAACPLGQACTDEVAVLVGSGHQEEHRAGFEGGAQYSFKRQDGGETETASSPCFETGKATTAAPACAPVPVSALVPPIAATAATAAAAATVDAAASAAAECRRSRPPEDGATRSQPTTHTTATSTTEAPTATTTAVATPTVAAANTQQQQQQRQGWRGKRLRPLVAASVGCYGAAIADGSEYRGDYGSTMGWLELKVWHKERLGVLAGAEGVDLLLFETVPCLAEVRAILSLLQDLRPSISAVISVSCSDDDHLRSGELVRDFAELARRYEQEPGAGRVSAGGEDPSDGAGEAAACVGIGVNCTDPEHVASALRTLSAAIAQSPGDCGTRGVAAASTAATATAAATAATFATSAAAAAAAASRSGDDSTAIAKEIKTPTAVGNPGAAPDKGRTPRRLLLVAYPNSGEVWDADARGWVEGTGLRGEDGDGGGGGGVGGAETFARMARDEWYTAGSAVRVFGGCCRTRPAHITEMRRALSALIVSQELAALPRQS